MIVQNTHLGNNLKIGTSNGSATYNFKKIHFSCYWHTSYAGKNFWNVQKRWKSNVAQNELNFTKCTKNNGQ